MIATDPLSLIFLVCIVFPGAFLIISTLMGLGHGTHLSAGHGTHVGAVHAHNGGAGHLAGHHAAIAVVHGTHAPALGTRVDMPGHHGAASPAASAAGQGQDLAIFLHSAIAPNVNAILTFLFGFGLTGYILHNITHLVALVALLLSLGVGAVVGGAFNVLMLRLFGNETGRLGLDSSDMTGRIARVSIAIRAGGVGEIIFAGDNGSRRSLGARGSEGQAIPLDADVVIVEYAEGIATVETWDEFLIAADNRGTPTNPPS